MHIAIFASGTGSNAVKIIEHIRTRYPEVQFSIWSNNAAAPILQKAVSLGIPAYTFKRTDFKDPNQVLTQLQGQQVNLIVLAGFLWLVPAHIVQVFGNQIINIHPALLPNYGGKGMHGMNVHRAVKENKEKESGITIHFVNEKYDEGQIILQERCVLHVEDSAEDIAKKVLSLEHQHFPKVVERFVIGELPEND